MNNQDRFTRWQLIRINQLTFLNNLILGLSIALLGYIFHYINQDAIYLNKPQKFLFWASLLFTLSSIFLAIILAINRLEDFKKTANIARKKDTKEFNTLQNERTETKILGKRTWCLFYWQIATFFISFIVFAILILIEIFDKIT